MKKKKLINAIGFCLFCLVLLYFIHQKDKIEVNEIDKDKIENFDLILSKGQSAQSKLVSFLNLSIDDYSHVGILFKENNELFVLHSTPDGKEFNSIRYDDLQTFIDLSSVSDFIVLRHRNISLSMRKELKLEFNKYKSTPVPFDFKFNNYNNQKIYCSELVMLIFINSELLEQTDFDLRKPIYPKYFIKMNDFVSINYKKTSP